MGVILLDPVADGMIRCVQLDADRGTDQPGCGLRVVGNHRPPADRGLETLDNIFLPPEPEDLLHRCQRAVYVQPAGSDDIFLARVEKLTLGFVSGPHAFLIHHSFGFQV
jgi:hypothetical protein